MKCRGAVKGSLGVLSDATYYPVGRNGDFSMAKDKSIIEHIVDEIDDIVRRPVKLPPKSNPKPKK